MKKKRKEEKEEKSNLEAEERREISGRNNFKPVYYFPHQKPFMEQKASEKLWTKRTHRGGTGDNLFKRKSCKAKVTSKTTKKRGMLACSSLLHCGVATLVCSILLVKLFLTHIILVLFSLFSTQFSGPNCPQSSRSETQYRWVVTLPPAKWNIWVCSFVWSCTVGFIILHGYVSWVFKAFL